MTQMTNAEEFKLKGSAAFKQGNYQDAISFYTEAINVEPTHVLYSNRSACYTHLQMFQEAVDDAKKCTELNPQWSKGFNRLGTAYEGMGKFKESIEAYQEAAKLDPTNPTPTQNMQMLLQKMMAQFQRDMPQKPDSEDVEMDEAKVPEPEVAPEVVKEVPSEKSEEELKREKVQQIKAEGNSFYKQKKFAEAIKLYDEAFNLSDEKEISCLTNKSAVLYEEEKFDEAIQVCKKAVEIGREIFADFKLMARAFGRIGNCYYKKDDLALAKEFYTKALTEHRTPDILDKLREVEKLMEKRAKEEYFSPELSQEARDRGNALFKDQKYAEAVKEYTEAIKRDENDPKAYSNRSACYHKLGAFPEAIKDCDKCIALDTKFAKAYLRKATLQLIMKDGIKAIETLDLAAMSCEFNEAQMAEAQQIRMKANMGMGGQNLTDKEVQEKAARDPEVQRVMSDPAMRVILEQMQNDPSSIQEHMKNPQVMKNLRVLINAGILRMQ
eukprot:NODE_46_length_32145_cov_0.918711.p7 type:complete len:496 gc:universal NODE_46_length_32145_cov_0.918711:2481-994(-)